MNLEGEMAFNDLQSVRKFISTTIKIFGSKRILDSPCGDCNWQPHIQGFDEISYTGVDIVPEVIIQNSHKYFNRTNMKFAQLDLVQEGSVLSVDVIQHLSLQDGLQVYEVLEKTGAKILITNIHVPSDGSPPENINIRPGDYYPNNPMIPPFNFGTPLFYILDQIHPPNHKFVAVFEFPVLGKGSGLWDSSLLDINSPIGKIVPVGSRGEKLYTNAMNSVS
ncbi:hypothetical protein HK096_009827 [Nowakowskiella sp. JEL0078]|nr:hypothetical protein HK096_009827 [Nowakowskiella sp. JEL0078]